MRFLLSAPAQVARSTILFALAVLLAPACSGTSDDAESSSSSDGGTANDGGVSSADGQVLGDDGSSPPSDGSSEAAASTGFPDATNTGVPAGTTLTPYGGSCTITAANTVIDSKTLSCDLLIKAPNVTVRKSKILGVVDVDTDGASVTLEDVEVDSGTAYRATVAYRDITIRRSNIHGGEHGVQCDHNCTIEDSWIHGQYLPPDGAWHLNAFISNGGSDIKLVHNTLHCDHENNAVDGGCSADASIFGDFSANSKFTFERNLFRATPGAACARAGYDPPKTYGTQTDHIVFKDNVFESGQGGKCGFYYPATSFDPNGAGNSWTGNVWYDGPKKGQPVDP